jgi:hypothetical protein
MIDRLYLRNFRGIGVGDIGGFAQINVLMGPNNSGKTTLLEALYLAATADREVNLIADTGRGIHKGYLAAEKDMLGFVPMSRIWQRHNIPPQWDNPKAFWRDGKLILSGMPAPLDRAQSLILADGQNFPMGDEKHLALLRFVPELVEEMNDKVSESVETNDQVLCIPSFVEEFFGDMAEPLDNRSFTFVWHPQFTYNFNGLGGWFVEGTLPTARHTLLYDFHTTSENMLFDVIERGYNDTDSFLRRIGRHLQEIFALEQEPYVTFEVIQDHQRRRGSVEQNQRMLPVDLWGDGMRHAMKVIASSLVLQDDAKKGYPGLMLWEDPELFMNPQTLQRIIQHTVSMIQDTPIQLFITTQSIEVIAYITEMLRDDKNKLPETSVKAFRLNRSKDVLQVSTFTYDNLISWLEAGLDPRFWEQQENALVYHLGGLE